MIEEFNKAYTVQHVKLQCNRPFDDVRQKLGEILPKLDLMLLEKLRAADTGWLANERATGPKLWLFLQRDHGTILAADGKAGKAYQYEIGNPLTAESMTREVLSAGLYAPLRVLLYEDGEGKTFFEYDLPSTQFGQFGNAEVTRVGLELDQELRDLLFIAAGA